MRLLVCDDSGYARRSLKLALPQDLGATIEEAVNGAEALVKCRAGGIDLMFLDLNMPVLDGFGVLTALQADGIALPIVVVTANLQSEPAQRAKALGAQEVLHKPADPATLSRLIRTLLPQHVRA